MATSSKEEKSQVPVEQDDLEAVLAVVSASPSVTIEELLHHLPWIRWGASVFHPLDNVCKRGR